MINNVDYDIARLTNNLAILKVEFDNFDKGKSSYSSREAIMDLMMRTRNELRKAKETKKKSLKLNNEKKGE